MADTLKSWATGKQVRMSPSSANTFRRCNRKWWFRKIIGLLEPTKPHLQLGTAVHWWNEQRALGRPMATDRDAKAALDKDRRKDEPEYALDIVTRARVIHEAAARMGILPPKLAGEGVDALVEARVSGQCGPMPYLGFVDYIQMIEEDGLVRVTDYKTTSSYYWGEKRPEDLARDPQMLFYAYALFPDPEDRPPRIEVEHIYHLTGDPKKGDPPAKRVRVETTWQAVDENWQAFVATAQEMVWAAGLRDQDRVPANQAACGDYKGCPYAEQCSASPKNYNPPRPSRTDKERPTMAKMTMAERLAARKAAAAAARGETTAPTPAKATRPGPDDIKPPDAAPTASPTDADFAPVVEQWQKVLASDIMDGSGDEEITGYLEGLLRRKSLPSTPEAVLRVRIEAGEFDAADGAEAMARRAKMDATVPFSEVEAVDADNTRGAPVPGDSDHSHPDDEATQPGRGGLTEFDAESGARAIAARLADEGALHFSGDLLKQYIRDAFDNDAVPRIGGKMRVELKKAGQELGLWRDEGGRMVLVLDDVGEEPEVRCEVLDEAPEEAEETPTPEPRESTRPEGPQDYPTQREMRMGNFAPMTVYVNCIPEGAPTVALERLLEPCIEEAEASGVEYLAEYGKGKDKVAARFAVALREGRIDKSVPVYVDSESPMASRALDVLRRDGAFIVRAVR